MGIYENFGKKMKILGKYENFGKIWKFWENMKILGKYEFVLEKYENFRRLEKIRKWKNIEMLEFFVWNWNKRFAISNFTNFIW